MTLTNNGQIAPDAVAWSQLRQSGALDTHDADVKRQAWGEAAKALEGQTGYVPVEEIRDWLNGWAENDG